jgi:2-polyprenyl-3-methyl-5-hydroxy-6-metoxy-1,4-benzoquinol methylase
MNRSVKFWDRISRTYDEQTQDGEQHYINVIENTKKHLKGSDCVLDLGCGTGIIPLEIADSVKEICAVDISSKMIQVAKRKAGERKIENIDFAQSTIFDERFKRESFDVILSFSVLHYLEDPQKAMQSGELVKQRISELLKPGGLTVSDTPCLREKTTLTSTLIFLASKVGILPSMRFLRISEVEGLITDGDFEIVATEESFYHNVTEYFIVAKKT